MLTSSSSSAERAEPLISTSWFRTCNTSLWMRIAPIFNAPCMAKMTSKHSCLHASPISVDHCRPAKYPPLDQQQELATGSTSVCMQCLLYVKMDVCAIASLSWVCCLRLNIAAKEPLTVPEHCCPVFDACFHATANCDLENSPTFRARLLKAKSWYHCGVFLLGFQYIMSGTAGNLLDDLAAGQCRHPICFGLSTVNTCHSNDKDPWRNVIGNNKTANSTLCLKCILLECHCLFMRTVSCNELHCGPSAGTTIGCALLPCSCRNPRSSRIESASADPTLEMGDGFGFGLVVSRLRIWSSLESSVPSPAMTWHLKSAEQTWQVSTECVITQALPQMESLRPSLRVTAYAEAIQMLCKSASSRGRKKCRGHSGISSGALCACKLGIHPSQ